MELALAGFVFGSWVLLPVTIVIGVAFGVVASIDVFNHPSIKGSRSKAVYFALAVSFIGAIGSSTFLALKLRVAASAVVVGCWSVFLVGATGAWLLVKPGPEYFQRYVGAERFSVPCRYRPGGEDRPNRVGFSVFLCLSNLRGNDDENCHDAQQFWIHPSENGFTPLSLDVRF